MRRVGEGERTSWRASAIWPTNGSTPIACGAAAVLAVRGWRWLLVGVLLALGAGCDKDFARPAPPASTGAGTGQPGYGPVASQPCTSEGEVKECGHVYTSNGDYLTCSVGHTTCVQERWSACTGDRFVVKSAPALRLTSAGLKLMALTGAPCTNACDPYCIQLAPDALQVSEVSAEGIVAADAGGVTLELKEITVSDGTPCIGLQCALVICGTADTTTISGRVFDPAGKNPLYNAEVYIPLYPSAPLPPFSSGASCDTCGGAQALDAIRATQSDANGNFTLSDVPTGSNVPVVVQMGKWRREIVLKSVGSCTSNVVTDNCTAPNPADCVFRLPRNQKDGFDPELGTYTKADMPQTAIISGSADPFDCLLLKAGIDPAEVGDSSSSKRIHYYASDSAAGSTLDPAYGSKIKGSELWNNLQGTAPNLMSYDVVLLPCEGGTFDKQKTTGTTTPYKNVLEYANAGGRMFATHYGYSWLAFPKPYGTAPDNWDAVADWGPAKVRPSGTSWTGGSINTQDPLTGQVNTAFPKGSVFSQWLTNVSASSVPRRLMIHEGRQDVAAVGATTQSWMTGKDLGLAGSPVYPNLFTYNTPYGVEATHQCGRVVYSDFHVSAAARTTCTTAAVVPPATVGVTTCDSDCLSDSDCGFTATCEGETPGAVGTCNEPCATPADCPNGAFSCDGAVIGLCEQTTCTTDAGCGVGRTCQSGRCTCTTGSDCTSGTCGGMTCDPTACHFDSQCAPNGTCGRGTAATTGTCAKGAVCRTDATCGPTGTCGSGTGSTKGLCKVTTSTVCRVPTDCDSLSCGAGIGSTPGKCATNLCHVNGDCDSNSCGTGTGSALGTCSTNAQLCHKNVDCDSNSCGAGTGSALGTCSTNAQLCHKNLDCDSNSCGAGTGSALGICATLAGSECHKNLDCDSNSCGLGTGAVAGVCATLAGTACHKNLDCDSNSCGLGTGAVAGVCATLAGTACHKNLDCDSNSCGTGTGAVAGICATLAGTACHKNLDCDSNSCGVGTGSTAGTCNNSAGGSCHGGSDCESLLCGTGLSGSTAGTCSSSGTSCHAATDCDSGVCGTGASGSTAGTCSSSGASCHAAADCDSASCGAGTCSSSSASCHAATDCDSGACGTGLSGSTAGTCSSSGASCHAATDCDSASCGATTLTKGTCNGSGICTSNTQCSGGSTCNGPTGSKRCTGVCALDTDCDGTGGGGTCNGATCAPKACGADSTCTKGASPVCNGATCTTKVCGADSTCTKGASPVCNGAICTAKTCGADSTCTKGASPVCNGATCTTKACGADSTCTKGPSPVCNGATCASKGCGDDSVCASSLCNNAKCSAPAACKTDSACVNSLSCTGATCSAPAACKTDSACVNSLSCTGATCSAPAACASDAACVSSLSCTGAKCSNAAACARDTSCAVSNLCNNAKCGNAAGCAGDASCGVSNLCNNAKCSATLPCAGDATCLKSGVCTGAKCSTAPSCAGDVDCPKSAWCVNSKCSTSTCGVDGDCPAIGTAAPSCTGMTCSASDCATSSDCPTGSICGGACSVAACTSGADCASGSCNGGVCGCGVREECGGSQDCNGEALGACAKACTGDAECAPDRCVNGQCGGCSSDSECHDYSYPASCAGIPVENKGICSDVSGNEFPVACKQGELSPQEKALEFMFFDLTACVSPDNLPPPKPVTNSNYGAATFVQDFQANCPAEKIPFWREFDFQAQLPEGKGTSIDFSAQSGDTLVTLLPESPALMPQATESTVRGADGTQFEGRFIDTGTSGTGVFNTASPAVLSKDWLRVTIALNPSADKQSTPRLISWKVQYDCAPAQ